MKATYKILLHSIWAISVFASSLTIFNGDVSAQPYEPPRYYDVHSFVRCERKTVGENGVVTEEISKLIPLVRATGSAAQYRTQNSSNHNLSIVDIGQFTDGSTARVVLNLSIAADDNRVEVGTFYASYEPSASDSQSGQVPVNLISSPQTVLLSNRNWIQGSASIGEYTNYLLFGCTASIAAYRQLNRTLAAEDLAKNIEP